MLFKQKIIYEHDKSYVIIFLLFQSNLNIYVKSFYIYINKNKLINSTIKVIN
jgi:hypothetical protein